MRHILPLLAIVGTLTASELSAQSGRAQTKAEHDTIRYVELVDGTKLGEWTMWREESGTLGYSYNRHSDFPRTERLVLDSAGLPVRLEVTGRVSDGVPWYERFAIEGGNARWFTPRERGEVAVHGPAFYTSIYPAHDLGVLARALLRRPSRSLPLLPDGAARLEPLGRRTVTAGGRVRTVRLHAVHGLELLPVFVWLDDDGATFAGEWSVQEGWEGVFDELRTAVDGEIVKGRRQIAQQIAPGPVARPLVIRGVRLFDPETGGVREGTTIVIEGERIVAVGADGTIEVPVKAEVIDARGRMALPGLWDAHAHLSLPAEDMQVFTRGGELLHLAAGVTTVRDVGSHVPSLVALREEIEAGRAVGPRIVGSGFLYDSDQKHAIGYPINTSDEARAVVDRYAALGFQQIKLHVYESELARAAIARAREHGMGVTGHLPDDMTSRQAVEAGYDVLMHGWWILWSLPWTTAESLERGEGWESWHQVLAELSPESEPVQQFIALLAERGTAVDPTVGYFLSESSPPEFIADVLERLPTAVARRLRHKVWQPEYFPRSPLARQAREAAVTNLLGLLPALHGAGVPILPGSDTWPGFGLHYELERYVEAGISAPDVLGLATLGAARAMGMDEELGSIEAGKLADLILVDGDPTSDISDIRRVVTVVKGGRVYDPAAIYRTLGIEP